MSIQYNILYTIISKKNSIFERQNNIHVYCMSHPNSDPIGLKYEAIQTLQSQVIY